MNWRLNQPILFEKAAGRGQRVVAAVRTDGSMPAIDYLEALSSKEQVTLAGRFLAVATNGPLAPGRSMLHWFEKGQEAEEQMGEFRLGQQMGVRLLCFRRKVRGVPCVVLANGFIKPNQKDTPVRETNLARTILIEYFHRPEVSGSPGQA